MNHRCQSYTQKNNRCLRDGQSNSRFCFQHQKIKRQTAGGFKNVCPKEDPLIVILKDFEECNHSVCFFTGNKIFIVLKKNGYTGSLPTNYENIYQGIIRNVKKYLLSGQCVFLSIGLHGHLFFIEINGQGQDQYIRIYQSYGGRYTLNEWLDPDVKLQQAKDVSYYYNVTTAQTAKDEWGSSNKISGKSLEKFIKLIQIISEMESFEEFDNAKEFFFGVKTPVNIKTGKPIDESVNKGGKISILEKVIEIQESSD